MARSYDSEDDVPSEPMPTDLLGRVARLEKHLEVLRRVCVRLSNTVGLSDEAEKEEYR